MMFGMISAADTGPFVRLQGKINATVYWRNMFHLICELQLINQLYLCNKLSV